MLVRTQALPHFTSTTVFYSDNTMATITTPTDDLLPPASIAETRFSMTKPPDLVLRSEDRMNFYVYKIVLSLASPFFADMFFLAPNTSRSLISSYG